MLPDTETVTVKVPAADGVPLIVPLEDIERPVGKPDADQE